MKVSIFLFLAGLFVSVSASKSAETPLPFREIEIRIGERSVRLWLVLFDSRQFTLKLINNTNGSGVPIYPTLEAAMTASGCLAGSNGGFYKREPFEPVGHFVCEGKEVGAFAPGSWMNGLLVVRGYGPTIEPVQVFKSSDDITSLLQSGPLLLKSGLVCQGLSEVGTAQRTFLCNSGTAWALGVCDPVTLRELAGLLVSPAFRAILNAKSALNFDGGPSTSLWVARGGSPPFYRQDQWPVQNYIGVVPIKNPKQQGPSVPSTN